MTRGESAGACLGKKKALHSDRQDPSSYRHPTHRHRHPQPAGYGDGSTDDDAQGPG